ncbi:MAG: VCBS repeat-containing protein, partial [Proteobacteria bacterium]|nr:VCBS repeat-containing protein [Pseudomonadota bacterium]
MTLNIRSVMDVNGDGWPDVIGSSNDGIFVALNDKNGGLTGGTEPLTTNFTWGGWIGKSSPRYFIDVNGDGLVDVMGLGTKGVFVTLGTGTGFKDPEQWSTGFLTKDYPDITDYRHVADMNGDGLPDIVGFGMHNVQVALNTGRGFTEPVIWLNNLAYSKGWDKFLKERFLLDVNRDGFPDLIGFQQKGVEIYLNKGVPNPAQQAIEAPAFNYVRLKSWDSNIT